MGDTALTGGNILIRLLQEQGRLGEVGGDDVGLGRQGAHPGAQGGGVGAVGPSVVPHDRVHQHQSIAPAEAGDKGPEHVDLPLRAQKAAVNGVEGGPQLGPVVTAAGHGVGQVQKDRLVRAGIGGVGREIGGEQSIAPVAHGREHRESDGGGAPSEPGQVLDESHLGGALHRGHSFITNAVGWIETHYSRFLKKIQLTNHNKRDNIYENDRCAGMVELADTPDLGSGGQPCRFKSCYPHQRVLGTGPSHSPL